MSQCSPRPGGYTQAVRSSERTVAFLYTLMRDHLPPGKVEALVCEIEKQAAEVAYSNDFLAAYAYELYQRLGGQPPEVALTWAHHVLVEAQAQ